MCLLVSMHSRCTPGSGWVHPDPARFNQKKEFRESPFHTALEGCAGPT